MWTTLVSIQLVYWCPTNSYVNLHAFRYTNSRRSVRRCVLSSRSIVAGCRAPSRISIDIETMMIRVNTIVTENAMATDSAWTVWHTKLPSTVILLFTHPLILGIIQLASPLTLHLVSTPTFIASNIFGAYEGPIENKNDQTFGQFDPVGCSTWTHSQKLRRRQR